MLLAELIADPLDKRPKIEKCKEAGFGESRIYELQHNPEFLEYVAQRTNELVATLRPMAIQTLAHEMVHAATSVERRSAARDLLTVTGDIGSGTNVVTNVTQTQSDDFPNRVERWTRERATKESK